jgi:NADH-quinone oxidoreductase subunit A
VPQEYLPILLCLLLAFGLGVILLGLSWVAAKQTGGKVKRTTYESGLPLLDRSRKRLSILFFLVALDFVVFDVEAAFLYPWALVIRDGGWPLFGAVMVFVAFLLAGYAYVWKKGGLDVRPRPLSESSSSPQA